MFLDSFFKLSIGLIGLIIVLRFIGKKGMSEITPLDLVYTLILGGIIESTLYDEQVGVNDMLIALAIWGVLITGIEYILQKIKPISTAVEGKTSVLIHKGKININAIEKNRMNLEQLRILMRNQDCFSLREVNYLILDPDGTGSVVKTKDYDQTFSYFVVSKGTFNDKVLKSIRMTEEDIERAAQKEGYTVKEVYYGEWTEEYGFYFVTQDDCINEDIDIEQ